jgi:hypothetical protein
MKPHNTRYQKHFFVKKEKTKNNKYTDFLSSGLMKIFILRNIQVVGMHHYGRQKLDRLGSYIVDIEAYKSYDPTAMAVYDGQRKVGNLNRDSAKAIHEVITANKS